MSIKLATVYWSGYGHTKKLAEAIHEAAAAESDVEAVLLDAENLQEGDALEPLDDCDAIIFGTPTYMGGPAAKFKGFIDAASGRWMKQAWKDKVAGGFTNSGSMSGDKQGTLQALHVNAMQHGMIWVGQAELPAQSEVEGPGADKVNRIGSYIGVMAKSASGSPEGPGEGDLETGRIYARRVVTVTKHLKAGRA